VVRRSIIVGTALEDFDPDRPFLKLVAESLECLLDNIFEDRCVALAVVKGRTRQNPLELAAHLLSFQICVWAEDSIPRTLFRPGLL
jgi:hypothetical protein